MEGINYGFPQLIGFASVFPDNIDEKGDLCQPEDSGDQSWPTQWAMIAGLMLSGTN
jgi:hypothetical protein